MDPNHGICPDAVEVMAWQAAASLESTPKRQKGIERADEIIQGCGRCVLGGLKYGDLTQDCAMAGKAPEFTSLGPTWVVESDM